VTKIRGDLSLVEDARDVADVSIAKRGQEFRVIVDKFSDSIQFERMKRVADCFAAFEDRGVIASDHPDRDAFVLALRKTV
jgi:hypothetical protein